MDDQPKHISETIERAVEGVLRFAGRFLRTFWLLLVSPLSYEKLLGDDTKTLRYSRPYTFLAIGGFFFTLIFSAFPNGLTGLFNIIWWSDDVATTLRDRSKEALTISSLLLAGIPVLLTVPALSNIYGAATLPTEYRSAFNKLAAHAFGYQTLTTFTLFYVGLSTIVLQRLLPELNFNDEPYFTVLLIGIIGLTATGLTNPAIALWAFQRKHSSLKMPYANLAHAVAATMFVILTFAAITYAASLPGAAKAAFADPPPKMEISFNGDPSIEVSEQPDGSAQITINTGFIIDNAREKSLIARQSAFEVLLRLETEGNDHQEIRTDVTSVTQAGEKIGTILLPSQQLSAYSISANTDLDRKQVRSLKNDDSVNGNDYAWFLVVQVREFAEFFEQSMYLSDSYVTWRTIATAK